MQTPTLTLVASMLVCRTLLAAPSETPTSQELIRKAVPEIVKMQEEGQFPYEGVYRVDGDIPMGYRVGGTAIVAGALLHAADSQDADAAAAVSRGLEYVLRGLDHPLLTPSTEDAYDVRVWGHAYALEFLCHLRAAKRLGKQPKEAEAWIPKLVKSLVAEQIDDGGWNYAGYRRHASFVTAPVLQALLAARGQGEKVPDSVFRRGREVLEGSRLDTGAFLYSGRLGSGARPDARGQVPGSIARSPICETTLRLLGSGSADAILASLNAFHEHWKELEARRRKSGTHEGAYGIAPYYCYYGHRYAAQAIEMLPAERRPQERERLLEVILRTRDADGTWNDRVFPRSRNFGTAMIVLALLGERTPVPPPLEKR